MLKDKSKIKNQMHYPIFKQYRSQVSELFDINEEEIFTKSKRRDIVDARQLLYFLCSERPMRVRYIKQYMDDNGYSVGHSTIIHGIKLVKERLSYDEDLGAIIKIIQSCVTV